MSPIPGRVYNVRDFGAKGDGTTLDSAALQAAIDACHNDRGGTVLVPAGRFVTGTLELKSNVSLHLAADATLLGSADGKQYRAARAIPLTGEHTMGDGNVGLIFAANAENITIEGGGTIDGQGGQFRSPERGVTPPAGISGNKRPHHVLFYQVRNLTIRDISLIAGAYHSVRICVCSYVKLDGIRIHNRVNHNNDGFHLISCRNVHISNCDVKCQDDACALFGSCKFITVSNSSFSTRWSVFRFGGGEAENIAVSNCLIYETYGCPIKMRCAPGSRYENISFSNLELRDVTGPISIGLGPMPRGSAAGVAPPPNTDPPGIVRNISFHGIRATVAKPKTHDDVAFISAFNPGEMFSAIILNGVAPAVIENVSFHDVEVTFPGGGTAEQGAVRDVPQLAGEYYQIGVPPAYGIYARNVRALSLSDVRFRLAAGDRRPAVVLDHVQDAAVNGLCAQGDAGAESLLRFMESRDVLLTAPRQLSAAPVFLRVEGATSRGITIEGGDLSKAGAPLAFAAGASAGAVRLRA